MTVFDEVATDCLIEDLSSELRRLCPTCRAARLRQLTTENPTVAEKLQAIRLGTPEDTDLHDCGP
jgi:hypothetical protein